MNAAEPFARFAGAPFHTSLTVRRKEAISFLVSAYRRVPPSHSLP